ncbi:claudin-6-like, partial [Colossoma macropomum]|uniref:claudin-6-like n=1 Tax=Colossoma macropomum TaxID=42526 RepID=UPI001864B262
VLNRSAFCISRPSISRHHSKTMKIVGFVLGLIGWILSIVTCILPMWKVTIYFGFNIVEGLWMRCAVQSTGRMQCGFYDSALALPSDLQFARIMTVISIFTALLALIFLKMGFKSIKDKESKAKFMNASGVFFIIAGILELLSVSWTTKTIIQDSYNPILIWGQNRDLGASVYIGFAAAALLIIAGVLLCCTCLAWGRR